MIAYKGTTNMECCNDLKYEVGKTYIFEGDLELCKAGFHACRDIADVNQYYPFEKPDTIVLEVEVPDDATIIDDNSTSSKFVTNELKVLRILSKEDIEKISGGNVRFNKNGRIEYIKYSNGFWKKYRFDKNGRKVYYEDSNGYWMKQEFNENGDRVYYENFGGYWERRKFDANGNEVYYENSHKYWIKYKYDENGNEVYRENSAGYWVKQKYDKNGRRIYFENSNGYWERSKFDRNGNRIYYENSEGIRYKIVIA